MFIFSNYADDKLSSSIIDEMVVTIITRKEKQCGKVRPIKYALFKYPGLPRYKTRIDAVRELAKLEKDNGLPDTRSSEMKKELPMFFPCGVLSGRHTKADLVTFSGLLAFDADGKDNPGKTPEEMKYIIAQFPFVLYCGLSVRGLGVWGLIPVPSDAVSSGSFEGYFRAISAVFEANGIHLDKSGINYNRGRFISYDSHPYYNENAEIWRTCARDVTTHLPIIYAPAEPGTKGDFKRVGILVDKAERTRTDIAPTAKDWFIAGRSLAGAFGEAGRQYFLRLSDIWSQTTGRPQVEDPDKKYTFCMNYNGPACVLGCLFNMFKRAGITLK